MSAMNNLALPFDELGPRPPGPGPGISSDIEARAAAVDPRRNVALSASAGTGKTRVLVDRYINLLKAGVDPANILAMTFTRKAATEMRQRIVEQLRMAANRDEILPARWRELRDRLGDIAISTIDAFCLSLLRDFPLEADLDPGFEMADDTEVPRLVEEALDHALRVCRTLAREDPDVALVFAQLGERRLRIGLTSLLDRRLVASEWLHRFQANGARDLTAEVACARAAARLRDVLTSVPGGLPAFLAAGPIEHPRYALLVRDIRTICEGQGVPLERIRSVLDPIRDHFFTNDGAIRKRFPAYKKDDCPSADHWKHHQQLVSLIAPRVKDALDLLHRDLNLVLARGVWRMYQVALSEYQRTLETHAVLDFPEVLARALALLERMDEFAQSRFLLEARYHHVLIDEFQDTSRAQWRLVRLLIDSWRHGIGLGQDLPLEPSIFIVGDRKQSIYGFRDADVRVFNEAAAFIDRLRPGTQSRRSIAQSFRSVPELLRFCNGLFSAVDISSRADAFTYEDADRFPVLSEFADPQARERVEGPALGLAVADDPETCVAMVAGEIVKLLQSGDVRDRSTGLLRRATPGDIAILFRSRETHREYEAALERRGVPTYVYKGLGFFDADEIKDVIALLRYLADPASNTRAAALLRSRIVRLSDAALQRLAPDLAAAIAEPEHTCEDACALLDAADRRALRLLQQSARHWLAQADRIAPADLLEEILEETAYGFELRGARFLQARENLKKIRGLVRRLQNHGYATVARVAEHLDRLAAGDESNAAIDALDAVNLMTVHASKGLEFPIVFIVNLAKGTGGRRMPIRVAFEGVDADEDGAVGDSAVARLPSVAIGDFESDADVQANAKEAEETKRLLYVACTRARDRLYLSTALKDGKLQPGRGSLAQVMPASFQSFLASVFANGGERRDLATWVDTAGEEHVFGLCSRENDTAAERATPPAPLDDFVPISLESDASFPRSGGASAPPASAPDAKICHLLRANASIAALLGSGDVSWNVSFSASVRGQIARSTVDCLVHIPDEILVINQANGTGTDADRQRLELAVEAVRLACAGSAVRGLLA